MKNTSKTPEFDVYEIATHPTRRLLVKTLHERTGSSFTELMEVTGENTGNLSFHLKKLEPLLSQDEGRKYYLNPTGEKIYSALRQMDTLEPEKPGREFESPEANLARDERVILSSSRVRPLGHDHAVGGFTKGSLHHVSATLTNRRLLLSSWRFFRPQEIHLNRVKLVRVRKDIPLTKGDSKGRSLEITYSDDSGKLHWVRFTPPEVLKWARAVREACSDALASS